MAIFRHLFVSVRRIHHCSTSCQRQALTDIVTAKHFTWISRRRGTRSARHPRTSAASNVVFLSIIAPSPNVFYSNAPGSPIYLGGTGVATNEPLSMAAGDFNGDGKLDLALGIQEDGNPGYVSVLLGNGDGTFTPVSSSPATGHCPCSMAIGDRNGDGKLDLAVANFDVNTVTILLGSGDGTFAPASSPPATAGPALVVGDFNGDGKLDLAVTNRGNGTLTILLGNGDGTFAPITGCCGTSVELTHTLGMAAGD